jgi:hypothetical protein
MWICLRLQEFGKREKTWVMVELTGLRPNPTQYFRGRHIPVATIKVVSIRCCVALTSDGILPSSGVHD